MHFFFFFSEEQMEILNRDRNFLRGKSSQELSISRLRKSETNEYWIITSTPSSGDILRENLRLIYISDTRFKFKHRMEIL